MKSFLLEHYKKKYKIGGKKTPVRKTGMWYQNGDVVVPSNQITMKGPQGQSDYFESPIMGVGMQSGQAQMMQPGEEYFFPQDEAVYETMMQEGGVRTSLNNISPQGDVSYSANANVGPFNFRGDSSTNILTGKQQLISPTISADFGGLGLTATSDMFSANYSGDRGYASLNRDRKNKTTDVSAGFNAGKFNLDANAFLDKDKLMNAGASAKYQVNPNLAFTGDINYSPEQGSPNYNIGFKYRKTFQGGGGGVDITQDLKELTNSKQNNLNELELVLGAAAFAPPPYGTAAGLASAGINLAQGDYTAMGLDLAGVASGGLSKWFGAASKTAKLSGAGRVARNMGDKAKFFQAASNPNIYKTVGLARDYTPLNRQTTKGSTQDNTRVAPTVRPKKTNMQMGGMSIPGVNGTVVAAPMSLKEAYKKKKKK